MAEDSNLIRLRGDYSRLKQHVIDLERISKRLSKDRKKLIKELKHLKDENAKLKKKLRESDQTNKRR